MDAYSSPTALTAGLNWYRKFSQDAEANRRSTGPLSTPLLYLRGQLEGGDIDAYVAGFQAAGVTSQGFKAARLTFGSGKGQLQQLAPATSTTRFTND